MVGGQLFAVSFHQGDRIRHCWVWITGQLTWSRDYALSLSCSSLHTLSCLPSCTCLNSSNSLASAPYSCLLNSSCPVSLTFKPTHNFLVFLHTFLTLILNLSRSKSYMSRLSSLSGLSRLLHISSSRYALLRAWWIVDHMLLRACVQQ